MKESFRKHRNFMLKALSEIPGIKPNNLEGAFYIFPEISDLIGKKFKILLLIMMMTYVCIY